MVTTNSLTPDLDFVTDDLYKTGLDVDRQIAEQAGEAIKGIIQKLKPVLVYTDQQIGDIRGIIVTDASNNGELVLSREGEWYLQHEGDTSKWENGWRYCSFSAIIEGLKSALTAAQEKRSMHMQAVERRKQLLSSIDELLHAPGDSDNK